MRVVSLSVLAAASLATHAATNYVAQSGAHVPPFDSWAAAATNVSAAVAVAAPGNRILISNGVYQGLITLSNRWLSLEGMGREETILRNRTLEPVVRVSARSSIVFESLRISNDFGAGIVCNDSTLRVERCAFVECTYNQGAGLYASNSVVFVNHALFSRNQAVYYGGAAAFLNSTGWIENAVFAGNAVADFTRTSGALLLTNSSVTFYHTVFMNNFPGAIESVNSPALLRNSIAWDNSVDIPASFSCVRNVPLLNGNITNSPALTVDGHLQWNSPCVDRGTNVPGAAIDIDLEPRPQGPARDMGADEWLSSAGDRVPDWWKALWGFDLNSSNVWEQDPNNDGVLNVDEYANGTIPVNTNILRIIGATNTVVRALKTLTNEVHVVLGTNAFLGLTCLTANAPGSTFDAPGTTGTFYWTPGVHQVGQWSNVTFYARDALLAVTNVTVVTVAQTNRAPVIQPVGAKTSGEGRLLSFLVTATDVDGDPLQLVCSNQALAGSTFTPVSNGASVFEWTPAYDAAGIYSNVFFGVTDGEYRDSTYATITITNVYYPPAAPSVLINGGAPYINRLQVSLTLFASNAAAMAIALDEAALTNWMPYAAATNWLVTQYNAENTVFARFRAPWLDETTNVSDSIIVETNPPTCTALFPPDGYVATNAVTLAWSATDDPGGSGVSWYMLQTNDGVVALVTNLFPFTSGSTQTNWWRALAYDRAGNTSSWTELRWFIVPEPGMHALAAACGALCALRRRCHCRRAHN
ncbi:right-handed parallel beta-helix repeat-containing protein [bacterium]|nr:right-handed parallel beta-helix repeat-containing protein [bacterium]